MANLIWLQGSACSGDTMSFLTADEPSACNLVTDFGFNVLWHPAPPGAASPRPMHKAVYAALIMVAAARSLTECRDGTSLVY